MCDVLVCGVMGLGLGFGVSCSCVFKDSNYIMEDFMFVHKVIEGGLHMFMLGCVRFEFLDVVAGVL